MPGDWRENGIVGAMGGLNAGEWEKEGELESFLYTLVLYVFQEKTRRGGGAGGGGNMLQCRKG